MKETEKIAVLKGGFSAEREVSLRTGAAVANALRVLGYQVDEVDVKEPSVMLPRGCGAAFIALHGMFGEDGQVQEEMEAQGIVYTGCGASASRLAFDKADSKRAFEKAGVPSPAFQIVGRGERPSIPCPYVVKPSRQGSSVGISQVHSMADMDNALEVAFRFDDVVVAEAFVRGRELTVGILGDEALPIVEIVPKQGEYNYDNKYTPGRTDYYCPAQLSAAVAARVQEVALAAHRALGCEVYSRVDVLLDADEKPWVLEVNTIPGMTETSLLPKAARAAGIEFGELCEKILEFSRQARKNKGGLA